MDKSQMDQLYHLLRVASNDAAADIPDVSTGLTPQEQEGRIYGLARHLLAGGDYRALVRFSAMYGELFIVKWVVEELNTFFNTFPEDRPSRIIDIGAGLGWLGRGLQAALPGTKLLTVDKRYWPLIDEVCDLETPQRVQDFIDQRNLDGSKDLIVMSDFLHCVDNPERVIDTFGEFNMAILEYCPSDARKAASYNKQLSRYGATSFSYSDMVFMTSNRLIKATGDPHRLFILKRKER